MDGDSDGLPETAVRHGGRAPLLVVVTGPPGAGKTQLAGDVARALGLPLLTKDGIKETLADGLDVTGAEWSRRLGAASFVLLARLATTLIEAGASLVVEGNFPGGAASDLAATLRVRAARGEVVVVQLLCRAEGQTLLARYRERTASGGRHPIHLDADHLADAGFRERLLGAEAEPLALDGDVIAIDTTDLAALELREVCRRIEQARVE